MVQDKDKYKDEMNEEKDDDESKSKHELTGDLTHFGINLLTILGNIACSSIFHFLIVNFFFIILYGSDIFIACSESKDGPHIHRLSGPQLRHLIQIPLLHKMPHANQ